MMKNSLDKQEYTSNQVMLTPVLAVGNSRRRRGSYFEHQLLD